MASGWLWSRTWAHLGTLGRALSYFVWQARHLATSTFVSRGRRGLHLATSIYLRFAWQAWHLATSNLVLRGRRGQPPPSFCVAGVALRDIHLRFAWQAWHLWHWAGSGGMLGRAWARLVAGDTAQLCVAGVALGDIYLDFGWQAWHLVTSTFVSAGLALGDIHLRFAWQAWHFWHWAGSGGALGRACARLCALGRR